MLQHGLSPAEEKEERTKWRNALLFFQANKIMDLSYDGYFRNHDLAVVSQLVNFSQPQYFSVDIESFPGLETWVELGYKSANFVKQPGESDSAASLRIAQSWLGGVVTAAKAAKPDVKVYMYDIWAVYDSGYQITSWPMAAAIGLADEPSYYGVENGLDVLAGKVRSERLAVGTGSELIPWLTPGATGGTGGPPDIHNPGGAMFNMLIQCW